MKDVHYVSLTDLCRRLKSGELSSLQVTRHVLDRIHALDGRLHSFARTLDEQAMADAERLDEDRRQGKPLGLLHGVPVAVKDLLNTRGKDWEEAERLFPGRSITRIKSRYYGRLKKLNEAKVEGRSGGQQIK